MTRRSANGAGSIYRRKDGRYEAAVYLETASGNRKRIRLYADSRAEAQRKLVDVMGRASRGLAVPDRTWTIGDYLDYWMHDVAGTKRRPRTMELYEGYIRRYLKPALGGKPLTRLSVADVQRVCNQYLAAGKSVRCVQIMRMVLSAALTRAMREELVERNVARLVELPTWIRKDIEPWSEAEAAGFLEAARSNRLYPAYLLLTVYGIRRGEVLGLRWSDVDFEGGSLRIEQQLQRYGGRLQTGDVKTRAGRRQLPLLPFVERVLRSHRASQANEPQPTEDARELVFRSTTGAPVEPGNLARTFYLLQEKAGLRRITVHHLRHTAATLLKKYGVAARDAQLILGHANVVTTQQIYQHADHESQRTGLGTIEKTLTASATNKAPDVYCRQKQPSSALFVALLTTGISGGPGGTRTHDILLKSLPDGSRGDRLTEVNLLEHARRKMRLLGCAAVTAAVSDIA